MKGRGATMKRLVAGILSAAMCAAVTTGCGSTGTKEAAGGKVTWWVPLSGNVSAKAGSLNETPFAEALQKETGIEVETPIGSQTRLRLPDGTIVILNAGSRIIYPQNFGVYNRDVELQGEGYFEVARNIEMPFYVKTKELQVRVLGTKFNFRDYPEDKEVVVSLLEGRIVLNNQLQREEELLLLPNEQVILDKRVKTMKKEWKRDGINIEWITGRLFFDEIPLPEVAQILERNYGVRIKFANDALKKIRFYGNFNKNGQSVRDILEALSATEKVHYTLNDKEIILY